MAAMTATTPPAARLGAATAAAAAITPAAATVGWSIYSLTSLTWASYTAWAEATPTYTRSGEVIQQSTMGAA